MSAPRIRINVSCLKSHRRGRFFWACSQTHTDLLDFKEGSDWAPSIAEAADAGRAHLAAHHEQQVAP